MLQLLVGCNVDVMRESSSRACQICDGVSVQKRVGTCTCVTSRPFRRQSCPFAAARLIFWGSSSISKLSDVIDEIFSSAGGAGESKCLIQRERPLSAMSFRMPNGSIQASWRLSRSQCEVNYFFVYTPGLATLSTATCNYHNTQVQVIASQSQPV